MEKSQQYYGLSMNYPVTNSNRFQIQKKTVQICVPIMWHIFIITDQEI
jgi:hypothetical protein